MPFPADAPLTDDAVRLAGWWGEPAQPLALIAPRAVCAALDDAALGAMAATGTGRTLWWAKARGESSSCVLGYVGLPGESEFAVMMTALAQTPMSGESPTEMPPEDDDETMPGPAGRARPSGAEPLTSHNALPPGTRLGEFEILGLVGEGGFGIVYLAHDHNLQRRIALKEYLPSSLAGRAGGLIVSVVSERHTETFHAGLRSFVNEARLLAKFDHPSLVKVYRFWEGNGTAYMVMPYYEGLTVGEALKRMGKPPDEGWLKRLVSDLLDALAVLHAAQCLHRDIAPDNILILESGRPVLLDFGAARRVIGDRSQALTVILKPGYAPVEQYADTETMKQGPWTDVYALASVAYFAIMGEPPTASVARIISDPLVPLAQAAAGRYSAAFLQALDLAMAVKPEDRPRDTAAMRSLLGLRAASIPARIPGQCSSRTSPE